MPAWSLAPIVQSFQALRGLDLIVAVTFATEIDDMRRFDNPRQLMGYLGLVPSERSTGDTIRRGSITKAGNGCVRHMLVESAWTYRHPPRIGKAKLCRLEAVSPKVREIAWKAQTRLTARYRALSGRGKKATVVCTASARGRRRTSEQSVLSIEGNGTDGALDRIGVDLDAPPSMSRDGAGACSTVPMQRRRAYLGRRTLSTKPPPMPPPGS